MAELPRLLADGVRYDPHYLPSMNSDHLPMVLCAMAGLGATDDQLLEFRRDYVTILREVTDAAPIEDWREGIGDPAAYPAMLQTMLALVAQQGALASVRLCIGELTSSLALDAFHPLIRLGYAAGVAHSAPEVAAALAYYLTCHRPLPVSRKAVSISELFEAQVREGPMSFRSSSFNDRLIQLKDSDQYPVGMAVDLAECARLALEIYRGTRNFFALHMVTSVHGARLVSGVLGDGDGGSEVLAPLTGALLAAHRIVGSPAFDEPLAAPGTLDPAHAFKYVYSCLMEYAVLGDERYLEEIVLFRDAGLIPPWSAPGV